MIDNLNTPLSKKQAKSLQLGKFLERANLARLGWETWTRTKIASSRGTCPTIRRSPKTVMDDLPRVDISQDGPPNVLKLAYFSLKIKIF